MESADCAFGHMFELTRSSTMRLLAVKPNAALFVIKSAGLSPNLAVFWLVRELSQQKGMGGSTISGGFGRWEPKQREMARASVPQAGGGHRAHVQVRLL
jgi:hypothetical protein